MASGRPLVKLPADAWDSHVHVIDEEKFPFRPDLHYRPKKADLDDLLSFEKTINIPNVCIVAISVYGTDNRSIIDALRRLNGKGRAVVCIDPKTIKDEELLEMHHLGARAVRLNLASYGIVKSKSALVDELHAYAGRLRPLGWALQIYMHLAQVQHIADELPKLGVPIVLDHLTHPKEGVKFQSQDGYADFISLLERKVVYTKLSGTYRFPNLPGLDDAVREILQKAPTQVVWASDWPHTGGKEMAEKFPHQMYQDFRKVDDTGFVQQCLEWCDGDDSLAHKIWVENPRRLWQV